MPISIAKVCCKEYLLYKNDRVIHVFNETNIYVWTVVCILLTKVYS